MLKKVLIVLILSLIIISCKKSPEIVADYVKLDKAYISVLILAEKGNKEKIKQAMTNLLSELDKFEAKNKDYSKRPDWKSDLKQSRYYITKAFLMFSANKKNRAVQSLSQARTTFYRMRKNTKIKYYLDILRDFAVSMDWVQGYIAKGDFMKPGSLSLLRQSFATARPRWKELSNKLDLLKEQFKLNNAEMAQVKKLLKAGDINLDNLAKALIAKNADAIRKVATKMKFYHDEMLKVFGHFSLGN